MTDTKGKVISFAANIRDGLRNVAANLGTARDKQSHSQHTLRLLNDHELLVAYRGSWLPRKVVDIPAFDACRRWRSWSLESNVITMVEREEQRHKLQQKVLAWLIASRLFGGAGLYIGTGAANPMLPLNPREVGRGGLRSVNVLTRRNLSPGPIETDIESEYYGRPSYWDVSPNSAIGARQVRVHPSRIAMLYGNDLPAGFTDMQSGWGDSILTAGYNSILQMDSTVANVASLIFEAKTDVIKIPDLMTNISDYQFEQDVLKRFTLAAVGKGNNGTLILDSEEDYSQKKMTFSTIPEVMDRFFQGVSGAFDIPMTRLFGMSPGGMNSTGDSDIRNYYDQIQSRQTLEIGPALHVLDQVLLRSALGYTPRQSYYAWQSLWQETPAERAENAERKANTFAILRGANVFSSEAITAIATNDYVENGDFPGIEEIVKKFPTDPKEGLASPAAPGEPSEGEESDVGDAAPLSLYVSRSVLNAEEIIEHYEAQGVTGMLSASDLHVTVLYCETPVDWVAIGQDYVEVLRIDAGGPRVMERMGDMYVLLFASNHMQYRHMEMLRNGAKHSYPDYMPHISLTEAPDASIPEGVVPYRGRIILGPEIFEEIE